MACEREPGIQATEAFQDFPNSFLHLMGIGSEREWQLERGGQWVKGKSADTFAPLGPWLATRVRFPIPTIYVSGLA